MCHQLIIDTTITHSIAFSFPLYLLSIFTYSNLTRLNDICATICDIANMEIPSDSRLDSMIFADLIIPDTPMRERQE